MTGYQDIITRLEAASGPDRELDARIYAAEHGHTFSREYGNDYAMWVKNVPHEVKIIDRYLDRYTASLDASIALVERKLPGWAIARIGHDDKRLWHAELRNGHVTSYSTVALAGAPTAALALLLALFRALQVQEDGEQ